MKQIAQSRKGPQGNCLQAAIASILELQLHEVPDFALMKDDPQCKYPIWWLEMQSFLKVRGFCFVEMVLTEKTPLMPMPWSPLVLMFGKTDAGVRHCIVGTIEDFDMIPVWNPDGGAQLTGVISLGLIVPLDPSKMYLKTFLPKIEVVDRLDQLGESESES